jgi:hypothetical protein
MKNAGYLFLVLVSGYCFAQSSGIGTNTPVPSSVFEVKSAAGGFLGPRLNSMQRDAIISPAEGLMIYNTDVSCYKFWNGSEWFNTCVDGRLDLSSNGTARISGFGCNGLSSGTLSAAIGFAATQQITVTVTRKGTYSIGTDTVNGIYFKDSGIFDTLGAKVITLNAYGAALTTGIFTYTLNTTPSCSFDRAAENESLLVISSQPSAPAPACSGTGSIALSVAVSGTTGITYAWR